MTLLEVYKLACHLSHFYLISISVVLQFEGSGKWPNDFEAIQNVKAAFYIKLASLLKAECSLAARASFQFVDVFKVR